jgi:hypothetical protein
VEESLTFSDYICVNSNLKTHIRTNRQLCGKGTTFLNAFNTFFLHGTLRQNIQNRRRHNNNNNNNNNNNQHPHYSRVRP